MSIPRKRAGDTPMLGPDKQTCPKCKMVDYNCECPNVCKVCHRDHVYLCERATCTITGCLECDTVQYCQECWCCTDDCKCTPVIDSQIESLERDFRVAITKVSEARLEMHEIHENCDNERSVMDERIIKLEERLSSLESQVRPRCCALL
jgi:hypothetical protein